MLLVVRASDGAAYSLYRSDLQNITTLNELHYNLLSPLLQIPPDLLICMNEEGAQLRDDSVPHLAMLAGSPASSTSGLPPPGTPSALRNSTSISPSASQRLLNSNGERRLYVFDREHLDADPDIVAQSLAITEDQLLGEAPLGPQDPLTSHIALSHHNLSTLRALIHSISLQRASLQLALSNLHRVMTGTSTSFSVFLESATPSYTEWGALLQGWEGAMDAVSRVVVVQGLLGKGHSRDGSTGLGLGSGLGTPKEKERFLGDYVSRDKMLAVKDGCEKVLNELKERTEVLGTTIQQVKDGAGLVKEEFDATSRDLEDLEACEHDAEQGHVRIEELVQAGEEMTDGALREQCFEELSFFDAEHRDRIRFLVQRKNAMTRYLVHSMQRISELQSDVASLPAALGELDHDLRTRTDNFKHLARLEGLIPAYVATVAEVVRRREFARLLSHHSSTVSNSLTPLSTFERSRRTTYRSIFSGKLPWEVRGLALGTDEAIPAVDFGVLNAGEDLPELDRETLVGLQRSFADLAETAEVKEGESTLSKARKMLDELVESLDRLVDDFEKVALGKPPSTLVPPEAVKEWETKLHALEETKEGLERELQAERSGREEELAQLNQQNGELTAAHRTDEEQIVELGAELAKLRREKIEWEQERARRIKEAEQASKRMQDEMKRYEELERDLVVARQGSQSLTTKLADVELQHAALRTDAESTRKDLTTARTKIVELEEALKVVEARNRDSALAIADKDRQLRDQRSEADVDRAVLEKETTDLRTTIRKRDVELGESIARITTLESIADGLREQIARWERMAELRNEEVGVAKEEVEKAKQERELGIVGVQRELVQSVALARRAVKLAGQLRDENLKVVALLAATPAISKSDSSSDNVDKEKTPTPAPVEPTDDAATAAPTPPDYDAGDLEELLAEVEKFSVDTLTDAVKVKVDSLTNVTRKWIKESKAYRERAHRATASASDKIAFRNFTKGDLALFLPTRNSTVPVWAAFNVSFPHHFLAATGVVQEQMKTREWIVARITAVTEKVVDVKDPTSNPYLLAPGTKFFLLEVEPWSSRDNVGSRSRKHSSAEKGKTRASGSGHARNRANESAVSPSRPGLRTTESAVLVGSPSSPNTTPNFRRSVSEGGPLPPNATALARSEYAIVEEDEPGHDSRPPSPTTLRQPVPRSDEPFSAPPSTPSALALSLARASPSARADPFSTNPFPTSSSPTLPGALVSPPATDFEPTITAQGAFPAFLPKSTGKKSTSSPSVAGSTTSSGPRYVRASPRPPLVGAAAATGPTDILSSSPASTAGSYVNFPRSASSGSSILSASMLHHHRRSATAATLDKALATSEAQMAGSRWNLLTDELGDPSSKTKTVSTQTLQQQQQPPQTTQTIGRRASSTTASRNGLGSSSVFEALTGRRTASTSSPSTSATGGAEDEMRKLLRK